MKKRINKKGYVEIKIGNKWKLEHIFVTENFLERNLDKGNVVHHLDLNKQNNLLNNLMPFKTQKEHKSFHNKLKQFKITNPIRKQIKDRWKEWI